MSHEEDLIDYSDEEIQPTEAPTNGGAGAAEGGLAADDAGADKTGSDVGIHSTGSCSRTSSFEQSRTVASNILPRVSLIISPSASTHLKRPSISLSKRNLS